MRSFRLIAVAWIVMTLSGTPFCLGQTTFNPVLFQAGIYGDDSRTVTCVSGAAGTGFEFMVWAWVPDNLGLAYITLRLEFPANIDRSARPVFNDLVGDVIITSYNDGTSEWNMLFHECPSGWVRVLSQECVMLDSQPAHIGISASDSMMRDCTFVLNDLAVLAELPLNDPGCGMISEASMSWSVVKTMFR